MCISSSYKTKQHSIFADLLDSFCLTFGPSQCEGVEYIHHKECECDLNHAEKVKKILWLSSVHFT